jgi:hypothetical protein
LLALGGVQVASAQSTIFNIPTTDTVEVKKSYVEFDYFLQTEDPGAGVTRAQVFTPRIVAGAVKNVEVGANFSIARFGASSSTTTDLYIQPNAKWKFASDDNKGLAGSAGFVWYTRANHRTTSDDFNDYALLYGSFSKKVKGSDLGPRITVGPYGIVGLDSAAGTKAGVIVGYEQPVHSKVSIVADWYSGVSLFGYFTPGVSITLPHSGLLNAGYMIGNDSYDSAKNPNNRFLFVYYGVTFGG